MNLARPLKAGIEEKFWICVASATIEHSTVADATKSIGVTIPASRGRAKFNRRSATKSLNSAKSALAPKSLHAYTSATLQKLAIARLAFVFAILDYNLAA